MFINTKKTIKIKSDNGTVFEARAGWIGEVPTWVEEHWFFKALCKDGSVTAIMSSKDKDIAAALEGTGDKPEGDAPPVDPNAGSTPPAGDKTDPPADPPKADGGEAATGDTPPVNVGTKGKGSK